VYREGDQSRFGMHFLEAMETVLDPVLALLDNLPAHFQPECAPEDVLGLVAAWMAVEDYNERGVRERRELVRRAGELAVRRGTKAGLELALSLRFPEIPLRVEDAGRAERRIAADELPVASPPSFVVYCEAAVPEATQQALARFIAAHKPAHVSFKLRVRNRSREKSRTDP
jgi:phage tail-like protein